MHRLEWLQYCTNQDKKLNQSLCRPGQAPRVPGAWVCQISGHSAHEGGTVSRTPLSPTPRRNYSWYSVLLDAGRIMSMKNFCDGIGTWTRDLCVVHCLSHLRHRVPHIKTTNEQNVNLFYLFIIYVLYKYWCTSLSCDPQERVETWNPRVFIVVHLLVYIFNFKYHNSP
jgi:hypothetical protein